LQQALEAIQAVLHRCQALCNLFHRGPLSVDLRWLMGGRHDLLCICGRTAFVVDGAYTLTVNSDGCDL
jgi:hypothetical protein